MWSSMGATCRRVSQPLQRDLLLPLPMPEPEQIPSMAIGIRKASATKDHEGNKGMCITTLKYRSSSELVNSGTVQT